MNISARHWKRNTPPKKVLAIRLHAMGDVMITLPYLQHLRNILPPATRLDFLTIKESETIPRNLYLFDKIYAIGGGRVFKKQLLHACVLLPALFARRYDMVLDLQNSFISRLARRILLARAWSTFDKVSPIPAGERTRLTIEAVRLGKSLAHNDFRLKSNLGVISLLTENGWNGRSELVILNPAGAFETRNWPPENYVSFAKLWLQQFPSAQFLVLGIDAIAAKARYFKKELGNHLINLVNKTTPAQVFAVIQRAKMVLTEDSGLMHMAWVSGIPTLALFGSTRSDWSRPLGGHTLLLHSSDLECGNCMLTICKYGDTHCLTRYTPEIVYKNALSLIHL